MNVYLLTPDEVARHRGPLAYVNPDGWGFHAMTAADGDAIAGSLLTAYQVAEHVKHEAMRGRDVSALEEVITDDRP